MPNLKHCIAVKDLFTAPKLCTNPENHIAYSDKCHFEISNPTNKLQALYPIFVKTDK
jgi:hypothetical protein